MCCNAVLGEFQHPHLTQSMKRKMEIEIEHILSGSFKI